MRLLCVPHWWLVNDTNVPCWYQPPTDGHHRSRRREKCGEVSSKTTAAASTILVANGRPDDIPLWLGSVLGYGGLGRVKCTIKILITSGDTYPRCAVLSMELGLPFLAPI
jgi:hypothetical protein